MRRGLNTKVSKKTSKEKKAVEQKTEHNAGKNFVRARKGEKNVDWTSESSGNRA